MRRLLVALAVALLVPATAQAKGVSSVALCGPEGCKDAGITTGPREEPLDMTRSGLAPAPGPYYEFRLSFEHGGQSRGMFYEPRSGLVSYSESFGSTAWAPLARRLATAVKEAAKQVEPFPSPPLTAVYVGDRRVTGDPETYLALFAVKGLFVVPTAAAAFEWIHFESPTSNPWTQTTFAFFPQDGVILTGSRYVKLPPAIAADIAAARPLAERPDGGTRLPWIALATAAAGLLILVLLALRRASAREVAPVH